MSVSTAQVVQIAHKKKTQINDFLRTFAVGTAFRGSCRHYASITGYEPKIVKQEAWYMTTVVFWATNWDSEDFLKQCGEDYLAQVGIIDDRQSDSNAFVDDEKESEERTSVFDFHF